MRLMSECGNLYGSGGIFNADYFARVRNTHIGIFKRIEV